MVTRVTKAFLIAACLHTIVYAAPCFATTNPQVGPATLLWRSGGVDYSEGLMVAEVWDPALVGWDGHVTRIDGLPYAHSHIISQFPYWSRRYQIYVTSAMVDAYWDAHHPGYVRVSSANQSFNCHGYATDYNTWIQKEGMRDSIMGEYWGEDSTETVLQYWEEKDHSRKVSDIVEIAYDYFIIQHVSTKNYNSGIYERYVAAPPGVARLRGDGYILAVP